MLPLDAKHSCVFVVKILLFYWMLPESSGHACKLNTIQFVNITESVCQFPKGYRKEFSGNTHHIDVQGNMSDAAFCQTNHSNCNFTIVLLGSKVCDLNLTKDNLSEQDIVVIIKPYENKKSKLLFYSKTGFCLDEGVKKATSQDIICEENSIHNGHGCIGSQQTSNIFTIGLNEIINCLSHENSSLSTTVDSTTWETTTHQSQSTTSTSDGNKKEEIPITINISPTGNTSRKKAVELMEKLPSLVKQMVNSTTANITAGNITGMITKLQNASNISVGFTTSGAMNIIGNNDGPTDFSCLVDVPAEASSKAVSKNGTFAAVLLFPDMYQDDPKSFFLDNKILGIEMEAEIKNLSHPIKIRYNNVDKKGNNISCVSWNGTGDPIWITDGCNMMEANGSILCQCSHLTFFALLMSSPPTNISASDYKSLSYITSIGCGLSMLFLAVALFMHCLIRKGKASQATKILMNLFIAMFILNLSFLVNESIANLENYGACVVTAAVMHYTMLATLSWFFVEALHIYFNMRTTPNKVKHYMIKISITGWGTPAIVVIAMLALKKYNYMVISKDDGSSSKMCWISDAFVQQGVNIGYYAIVFIFTFGMFIVTVRQIVLFQPAAAKPKHNISIKTKTFSILALFFLLGITWAFAFFSYGPLLIPSYYIFTILNSFQGFFLFIYYYNTSKIVGDDRSLIDKNSTTPTSNTIVCPYQ